MANTVRLVREPRPTFGDFMLDAFVVELADTPAQLDFWFQLGQELSIYRGFPAGPLEPLRVWHVDGAVYHLSDPELVADPWRVDVPRLEWTGELGVLGNGDHLVAVRVEVHASPASYRCELVTRAPAGVEHTTVLAWREPPAELRALAPLERADALDTLLRQMAHADPIDLAGIGMVHVEVGALMDAGCVDGAQYAAIIHIRDLAVRAELAALRAALRHGLSGVPVTPPVLRAGPVLRGHRAYVSAAAFAPHGNALLTGDENGALVLYDRPDADAAFTVRLHVDTATGPRPEIGGLAWAASAGVVAVHEGATVRLRDATTLTPRTERGPLGTGPLGWGTDDVWVAVLGANGVHVLDGTSLGDREVIAAGGELAGATIHAFAVDAATARIAIADDGGTEETALGAVVQRGEAGVVVGTVGTVATVGTVGAGAVRDRRGVMARVLAFDPWRRALIAATYDGRVVWWTDGAEPARVERPFAQTDVRALIVTRRWLVLAPDRPARAATLEVYDAEHFAHVLSVAVPCGLTPDWMVASPDGRALVTREPPVGGDFGVRLWFLDG